MIAGRARRLIRGAVGGSATTLLALVFHVVGGGESPPAPVVAGSVATAVWVCTMIGSQALRLPVLAAGIAAAQFILHWVFSVSTGTGEALTAGAAGAHDHTFELAGLGMGHAMWWSHVAAGVITLVVLTRGERVLVGLLELAALAVARIVVAAGPAPARRRLALRAAASPATLVQALLATTASRRGPPVAVV